ncbi:MAG: aminopeptidase [Gemmatimonadota bacterium]|nr:aminopeptidase [Gemmatimonadota bacterium]
MSHRLKLTIPCVLACLLAAGACAPESADVAESETDGALDFPAIVAAMLERADLQPGERVLLVGQAGTRWDSILPLLSTGIQEAGAAYLGAVDIFGAPLPGAEPAEFAAGLGLDPEGWADALAEVDLAVKLPGATPSPDVDYDVYRALQDVLRGDRGRTVHFHWAGATSFGMVELPVDENVDMVYQRALLETDYEALAATLTAFEAALRAGVARVTTPAGTDISFEVADRPVTRQDGDASAARMTEARNLIDREVELPAGAARVSPVPETVEGRIAFPPAQWGGSAVEGLVLSFVEGRVVDVEADSGREGVIAEMDAAGDAGRTFRELAVGFNPLLAIPNGEEWIPYYGYGGGVVRLSLGDNTELGGAVGGGYVRWNFFTDATVMVGGEVWVRDGVLVAR